MDEGLSLLPRAMRVGFALLAVGAIPYLAACGGLGGPSPTDSANPYEAEFDQARRQADDPQIVGMLADGVITDAELEQARQLTLQCLTDRGFEAEFDASGGLKIVHPPGVKQEQVDDVHDACAGRLSDIVEPLYNSMKSNPGNVPPNELLLACLKRFDIVNRGMTLDEFNSIYPDRIPWNLADGDVDGCERDPIGYQGGNPDLATPPEYLKQTVPPG